MNAGGNKVIVTCSLFDSIFPFTMKHHTSLKASFLSVQPVQSGVLLLLPFTVGTVPWDHSKNRSANEFTLCQVLPFWRQSHFMSKITRLQAQIWFLDQLFWSSMTPIICAIFAKTTLSLCSFGGHTYSSPSFEQPLLSYHRSFSTEFLGMDIAA